MTLISLPVLLYVIPAVMLIAALVPPRRKPAALGIGGVVFETVTGGVFGLTLLMLSVCSAWLMLRLMPAEETARQRRIRLGCGIGIQAAVLIAGKLLLTPETLLPILLCAMLGIECMQARAQQRMHIPPLIAYLGAACAMPHFWAGPVMAFGAMREMTEKREASAENIGSGARLCVRGLFQMALLSLPMTALLREIGSFVPLLTAADAWLTLLVFYCSVYYGLRGAVQFGSGLALMLGYRHPAETVYPIRAASSEEFWRTAFSSAAAWTDRVLLQNGSGNPGGIFLRLLPVFGSVGVLLGNGWCGLIWGVWQAAVLTLGRLPAVSERLRPLPKPVRRCGTALLMLLGSGLLMHGSLAAMFAHSGALLGVNGTALSDTVRYLCGEHFLSLLLCIVLLFPIVPWLETKLRGIARIRKAAAFCVPLAELGILLCCMAELLSQYLRAAQ